MASPESATELDVYLRYQAETFVFGFAAGQATRMETFRPEYFRALSGLFLLLGLNEPETYGRWMLWEVGAAHVS
jgi:hypothetical protein